MIRTLLSAIAVIAVSGAAPGEQRLALATKFTVELTCGKSVPLRPRSSTLLVERALTLLQSSENNSFSVDWHFPMIEVQEEFDGALASEHLRVVFKEDQALESRGGPLHFREIVVRLGPESRHTPYPDRFVDSVFTIDGKGRVTGYALYLGTRMIELYRAVMVAAGSVNECKLPSCLPLRQHPLSDRLQRSPRSLAQPPATCSGACCRAP
jgi:hypothetical protein